MVETGVGNAMVGHYLSQLSLPEGGGVRHDRLALRAQ